MLRDQSEIHFKIIPDGTISFANKAFKIIAKVDIVDFIGKNYKYIIDDTIKEYFSSNVIKLSSNVPVKSFEFEFVKDNKMLFMQWYGRIFLDDKGNPKEYLFIGKDISRLTKTESLVLYKDEIIDAIMNATMDLMMLVAVDGTIELINYSGASWFNRNPDEMIGDTVNKFLTRYELKHFDELLLTGRALSFEHEHNNKYFYNNYYPVYGENEKILEVAIYIKNITKIKTIEMELIRTSEEERQKIGHDLHDGIGQELTGMLYLLNTLKKRFLKMGYHEIELIENIIETNKKVIKRLRKISKDMVPVSVGKDSLIHSLKSMAREVTELYNIPCTVESTVELTLESFEATNLFLIIREAVTNAVKHGNQQEIKIYMNKKNDGYNIKVKNIIDPYKNNINKIVMANEGEPVKGIGLNIMKYRANLINADCTFMLHGNFFIMEVRQRVS